MVKLVSFSKEPRKTVPLNESQKKVNILKTFFDF